MNKTVDADRLRREPTDHQTLTTETLTTPTVTPDVSTWDRLRSMLKKSSRPAQNTPDPSFLDPSTTKVAREPEEPPTQEPETHAQEIPVQDDDESQGARSKATTTHSTHYTLDQDAESAEHFPADRRPIGPYCKLPKTPNVRGAKQVDRDAIARWIESTYETDNPWVGGNAPGDTTDNAPTEQPQQPFLSAAPILVSSTTDETLHHRLKKLKDKFRRHH